MLFALTPHRKADGNLNNKNLFKFDAENSIALYFLAKIQKNTMHAYYFYLLNKC